MHQSLISTRPSRGHLNHLRSTWPLMVQSLIQNQTKISFGRVGLKGRPATSTLGSARLRSNQTQVDPPRVTGNLKRSDFPPDPLILGYQLSSCYFLSLSLYWGIHDVHLRFHWPYTPEHSDLCICHIYTGSQKDLFCYSSICALSISSEHKTPEESRHYRSWAPFRGRFLL